MKPRVIVSVINDLVTDQRVSRTCDTLQEVGFDVLLVGRKLPDSLPLHRNYSTKRFNMLFRKKLFFYAEYNLKLFFFLLFKKTDLLVANDIDTALANHWIHTIKKTPLLIDCHEYFCGVPELVGRKNIIRVWKRIEKKVLPKANRVITVNNSIASLLQQEYHIDVDVIKNVPKKITVNKNTNINYPNSPFIIYQGAVNIDRGIEEMINAMQYLPDFKFVIAGKGDILENLKQYTSSLEWKDRIVFLGVLTPELLKTYTQQAVLGISLEKDTCINYHYCLPNKLFDYIHAGIPVLVSDLPEMRNIVNHFQVGQVTTSYQPKNIAETIQKMYQNTEQMNLYRKNALKAAEELCWEKESKILANIYSNYLKS